MKYIALVIILSLGGISTGKAQLNKYEYVVVPKKLQDFDQENKYHTSTLLKYLLKEEGFTAYYDGEVPADMIDKCKGLRMDMLDESSMFRTKVFLVMRDCKSGEIFRSKSGESRIKSYKEGYEEAIRMAFQSIEELDYHYEPAIGQQVPVTLNFDKDVKSVAEPVNTEPLAAGNTPNPAITQQASPEVQRYVDKTPKQSAMRQADNSTSPDTADKTSGESPEDVLYAQRLPNGYQLVDRSPKIRFRLYDTSLPDVYLSEHEGQRGLVHKKGDHWYLEFYRDGARVVEELAIKF